MALPIPQVAALPNALRRLALQQMGKLPASVGDITEADLAAAMPEARQIYAMQNPDPDPTPLDLREWACQRIAVNVISRARGFDIERVIAAEKAKLDESYYRSSKRERVGLGSVEDMQRLAPLPRTGDDPGPVLLGGAHDC